MFKIIQISDLHFGTENQQVILAGQKIVEELKPDLIVVAGDLTQRNWSWQYFKAVEFLKSLNRPILIVPGNHDIPLFNFFLRFRKPLKSYDRFFNLPNISVFENNYINIVGVNSTDGFQVKNGKLTSSDMEKVVENFQKNKEDKWNIFVTHHPLIDIKKTKHPELLDRLLDSMNIWLAGHTHKFRLESLRLNGKEYKAYQCVSGTFVSNRLRNEENSFNLLEFENNKKVVISNYYFKVLQGKFIRDMQMDISR